MLTLSIDHTYLPYEYGDGRRSLRQSNVHFKVWPDIRPRGQKNQNLHMATWLLIDPTDLLVSIERPVYVEVADLKTKILKLKKRKKKVKSWLLRLYPL